MTIETLVRQAIHDNASHAKATAAGLGADALTVAEVARDLPDGASPALVKNAAHAIQARVQKATLGLLAAVAAGARLEAYAHVLTLKADAVRKEIEIEADGDVVTYQRAVAFEGEEQPAEQWAAEAFASWLADEGDEAVEPFTVDEARGVYIAAFLRALGARS